MLITHCSFTRDPPQKCTPARLRMLTVHGELPGCPPTMRPLSCSLSSRRPHCSNVTASMLSRMDGTALPEQGLMAQ